VGFAADTKLNKAAH